MSRVGPATHKAKARTFGVEEEFLLVDSRTGQPMPVAEQALSRRHHPAGAVPGPALTLEVKQEQLEAVGPVCSTLPELASAIRAGRTMADEAAKSVGARAVALGTSPLPTTPTVVPQPRYLNMAARFGLTFQEQLTCGFHVHVRIRSADEGVAILDRIRIWLPVVLALSGNSPFWRGTDSGYASFRYQAWGRWQTAGPCERFGSAREYRRHIRSLLATGVLLDEGMVYFDARLSRSHPTVEVRIADVCLDARHAAVIAALVRALVGQAAREVAAGRPAPRVSAAELRLASWKASSAGVDGTLVHPLLNTPCPATEAVQALLAHVHPSLAETGDDELVTTELARILAAGTGARRQREVMLSSQSLTAVVMDAVELTHGTRQGPRPVPGRLQSA
ncbi:glutamate--cysteine ligase [Arthrobacter sp. ISL-65]|uniref:glutamate--cysteine ligase n=1 Tax=Arthrobacter sp. ISL-65 TaxID=2819112 RepID=UPI001BEB7CB5|nr:glutamate--cysteine ligase [Arthrobacter sp. ISL-65]MBT2549428.1 glutamate--cysteine ligase [Arthrobacter sp. ISL-65]